MLLFFINLVSTNYLVIILSRYYTLLIKARFVLGVCSLLCLVNCHAAGSFKSSCKDIKLQILGSGGPEIDDGLASSSYLIWINNKASILVDAGGGSSLHFEKSGAKFNDLQAILLTHLHVDHSAELPVYIKAGYFSDRDEILPVLGPNNGGNFPSTEEFVQALFDDRHNEVQSSAYPYLSDNLYQQPSTDFLIQPSSYPKKSKFWEYKLTRQLKVTATKVTHGAVPAIAWRVDYQGCSISFSGDMNGKSGNLNILAKNSDWLVAHNAIAESAGRVAKILHMTPSKIGEIAANANVKNLVLSHFMNRSINKKKHSIQQIKRVYQGNIYLSKDLQIYNL